MFRHRFLKARSFRTQFDWMVLSFLAGNVNAGGFLAAQRFVTHVTGFATLFGIDAAQGRWDAALGIATIPIYFLVGVMVSATLVERRIFQNKRPRYALVMILVCACLVLAAVGGGLGLFSTFGGDPKLKQDYFLLALLCGASGLQNAVISSATGATYRSTHLTGLTTDLGTGIVRAFSDPKVFWKEMRANFLRAATIGSFCLGSAVGAFIYLRLHFWGFLVPACIAAYAAFEALHSVRRLARLNRSVSKSQV